MVNICQYCKKECTPLYIVNDETSPFGFCSEECAKAYVDFKQEIVLKRCYTCGKLVSVGFLKMRARNTTRLKPRGTKASKLN